MKKGFADCVATFLFLSVFMLFLACRGEKLSSKQVKQQIVGNWEEVKGTRETLQFNADGTLIMQSPAENRSCEYSFPDSGHIRLDCVRVAGAPRTSQTFKFSMTSDRVMISDEFETGTYKRTQDSAPAQGAANP